MWSSYQHPLEKRVVNAFLMGLRTQLLEWKFGKAYIKVDLDDAVLKAGGKDILKVRVLWRELQIDWVDPVWAAWKDIQESAELISLHKSASDKPAKNSEEMAKGASKGPHQ